MFKTFLIIVLCIAIFISYDYLQNCLADRKALPFTSSNDALILQKKEIILDAKEDFIFEDYFTLLDFNKTACNYTLDEENVTIYLNGLTYQYPYFIRKKEKEIVEVTVYKEIYHDSQSPQTSVLTDDIHDANEHNSSSSESYLHLNRNSFSYPVDTDLNKIISDLSSCFSSNVDVLIDFSRLNCSAIGTYPVYFNYDEKQQEVIVNII